MNLDLHKELYFFEWNRKEQLASFANLPVALLTVLAGGVLFLVQSFPYSSNLTTIIFVVLAGGCTVSWIAGVYFLVGSLHGYWYEQIPSPEKLQVYFEELKQYHNSLGNPAERAQQDFDEYMQARLAEATGANRTNNRRTAGALHKATGSIVVTLIIAGLSFLPYLAESLSHKLETPTVRIESPVEIRSEVHMPENDPQGQSQSQPQPQQEPSSQPPKPEGPPNEQVRKGGDIREKR